MAVELGDEVGSELALAFFGGSIDGGVVVFGIAWIPGIGIAGLDDLHLAVGIVGLKPCEQCLELGEGTMVVGIVGKAENVVVDALLLQHVGPATDVVIVVAVANRLIAHGDMEDDLCLGTLLTTGLDGAVDEVDEVFELG